MTTTPSPQRQNSKTVLLDRTDNAGRQQKDKASMTGTTTDYASMSDFLPFTPFTGKRYGDNDSSNLEATPTSRMLRLMTSPITGEEHGSQGVWVGLCTFMLVGCLIGAIVPKNETLPTLWYRTFSSCIGYSYFLCWAVSFYPQAWTNWKRTTTVGLSADFCALNVLGFACYAIYNVSLFFNAFRVQDEYRQRHGANSEITVQSNDVAFAVHAFVLSSITLCQIGYYDGFQDRISKEIGAVLLGLLLIIGIGSVLMVLSFDYMEFLDFLYLLSYIKIFITLLKYMPQIILNIKRRSTVGFSIWQILLDLSGGLLSILQLVLDCLHLNDFSGLTGNMAKFLLGAVSVVLDTIIILQHYVWYPNDGIDVAMQHGGQLPHAHMVAPEPTKSLDVAPSSKIHHSTSAPKFV